jgi:LytS/YehU family sensor histidine kinase
MLDKFTNSYKLLLISLLGAVFIIYINIAYFPWEFRFLDKSEHLSYILFFIYRYFFFAIFIWILLWYNLRKFSTPVFKARLRSTLLISVIAYLVYIGISFLASYHRDCFTGTLLFQFFVTWIISSLIGHLSLLYSEKRRKELEIEQLKIENLQSRCDALSNQINPHFFFNSLNGLTSLIRKKNDENTLAYVNKLSDVFRYILQSEKKGLVPLEEELEFMQSFRYMMEVRFASKLVFTIDVDKDKTNLKIPVLSLLPLIDNVVVHNIIDSEHKMVVTILLNKQMELVVSNPVFPKPAPPDTNGTGLKNLENRFALLMNKQIRIENDGKMFHVYLPLK